MAVQSSSFSELYGERLTRELGSDDTSELFTTVRRKSAINEAALEFVKQTECYQKQADITLVDDTREYDLEASAILSADDFLWIASQGVEYAFTDENGEVTYRSGDDFPRRDIPLLNRQYGGWRNTDTTTYPASYYIRRDGGKTYIGLSEPPSIGASESAKLILPYVAKPTEITDDSEVPFTLSTDALEVLEPYLQAIVHKAASFLEPLRKNYAARDMQNNLFAAVVADYLQKQRPKGGQSVLMARNYYREARRGMSRRVDPRVDFA
jgi:hypothetical protein